MKFYPGIAKDFGTVIVTAHLFHHQHVFVCVLRAIYRYR